MKKNNNAAWRAGKAPALAMGMSLALTGCGGGSGGGAGDAMAVTPAPDPVASRPDWCREDPQASGYCLVWADEFDGDAIDSARWSLERNCFGGGNDEAQCYVDTAANSWVADGLLHIKAIREDLNGPALMDDHPDYDPADTSGSGTYSSARLRSKGTGDWAYGRFEIRAKLPAGQGTWPAIWMLPTDWSYGGWASSGEIDIMEAVNLKVGGEGRVHGTLHYGGTWPGNVYTGVGYHLPGGANPADGFHTYALEWEQGEIRWYVDGDHYATQTSEGWYSTAALDDADAPFNQRFHMILNLAVGGSWAANVNDTGVDESAFPQELQVDYVRVYQCTEDRDSGRGCAGRDNDYTQPAGHTPPQEPDASGNALLIFDGAAQPPYVWGSWASSGSVAYETVDAGGDYGSVAQVRYDSDDGIGFFQSPGSYDLSGYTYVEFDLKLLAEPADTFAAKLLFRADCTWPCTSGDYELSYPTRDTWTHYQVPLLELQSAGLELASVNTPFVIYPGAGNQQGVVLQIDNVRLTR